MNEGNHYGASLSPMTGSCWRHRVWDLLSSWNTRAGVDRNVVRTFFFCSNWGTRTDSFSDFFSRTVVCSPAVGARGAATVAGVFAPGAAAAGAAGTKPPLPASRASASKSSRSISSSGKPSVAAMLPDKSDSPGRGAGDVRIFGVKNDGSSSCRKNSEKSRT